MSAQNYNIEKYDFDAFEKEHLPYTMIPNQVIQTIPAKKMKAGFLWVFLQSLSPSWKINKTHITKHFEISESTYERWMSWLNTVGLIEYRQERNANGSFGKWKLIVLNGTKFNLLSNSCRSVKIDGVDTHRSAISPLNGEPVATANDGHINTTQLKTQKKNKKARECTPPELCNFSTASDRPVASLIDSFEAFWKLYPNKKDKKKTLGIWKRDGLSAKTETILEKLQLQIKSETQWKEGYIPLPSTYLSQERWKDEITPAQSICRKQAKKDSENQRKALEEKSKKSFNPGTFSKVVQMTSETSAENKPPIKALNALLRACGSTKFNE